MKKFLLMTTLLLASIVGAQAQKLATTAPQLKQKVVNVPKLDGKLQKVDFNQSALTMARKNVAPGQVTSRPMQAKRAAGSAPSGLNVSDITQNSATVKWNRSGNFASYEVRYKKASEEGSAGGAIYFEDFESTVDYGLPEGWTSIDADGDGKDWYSLNQEDFAKYAHSGQGLMTSASWQNSSLTPDNWLITPLLDLQGTVKMWMYGQDPAWSAEVFAVYLYIPAEGDDEEITTDDFSIELIPETTVTGSYVQYSADLSAYEGQQGYIAIRHFDVTDMFRLNLDDFGIYAADDDGDWTTLTTNENSIELTGLDTSTTYDVQVRGVNDAYLSDWSALLQFTTLAGSLWYLSGYNDEGNHLVNQEIMVDINPENNVISITGLSSSLPDGTVTGTLSEDGKTATFQTGQKLGVYGSYDMYFVGYNIEESEEDSNPFIDVVFDVDLDNGVLTLAENTFIFVNASLEELYYLEYFYDLVITHDPLLYSPPTLEVSDVTTNSATLIWEENSIEEVSQWVIKYSPLVTSVDEDGNKSYYLAEDGELQQEIVVDENPYTLTDLEEGTPYVVWVRPEPAEDMWSESVIFETKINAVAAVPADPIVSEWYDCGDESGFSRLYYTLPETDVDGNNIDKELLSYSVFTDDDQLFTFDADSYTFDLEEDITEVPYELYSNAVDFKNIYTYFYRTNEGDNPFFTKRIGIQVYYTVDGVKNASNIVYWYLPSDIATGIHNVTASEGNDTWYTLDGRKLSAKPMTKGVFIKNGQKVVNN